MDSLLVFHWQDYRPLITRALEGLHPGLDAQTDRHNHHAQQVHQRITLLEQVFDHLDSTDENLHVDELVTHCLQQDVSYDIVYGELMTLARLLLGQLSQQGDCAQLSRVNQAFDRLENTLSHAYFQQFLRKLAVKNHLRLSHLVSLSEKNLMVHYQNHLQWMLSLITRLQSPQEKEPYVEHNHTRCTFGQWLHGKAIPALKDSSHFHEVGRLHVQLHQLGQEILERRTRNDTSCKSLIQLMQQLDYLSLEIGTEIAILNDMIMISEYHKDPLTGVLSRHLFDKVFSTQIDIAKATESHCTLLMMDLDHFKNINDTHGHLAGDAAIRAFASILKASLRQSDFIFRYGGEEFLAILPATDRQEGRRVAEKVRDAVAQMETLFEGTLLPLTVSIGVTSIDPASLNVVNKETLNHYIGEADARLYLAKRNGRNRVE